MIVIKCSERDRETLNEIYIDPQTLKDDGTIYLGVEIIKPWGCEMEKYRDDNVSVWLLNIKAGQQTSMHSHPNKTTLLTILSGEARLTTLNESHELKSGDMVIIEKGAFHRTSSKGGQVFLYELETPVNKRDLVRLADSYGRGQGYEKLPDSKPEKGTGL